MRGLTGPGSVGSSDVRPGRKGFEVSEQERGREGAGPRARRRFTRGRRRTLRSNLPPEKPAYVHGVWFDRRRTGQPSGPAPAGVCSRAAYRNNNADPINRATKNPFRTKISSGGLHG